MRIEVSARHMELTDSISEYAEKRAEKLTKYYDRIQQIDVIVDEHDFAAAMIGVHAATSIRDDQQLRTQVLHDAYGKRDLFERVSLVHVESAFHCQHRQALQLTTYKAASVASCGRARKVGYILVVETGLDFDLLGKTSQTSTSEHSR